MTSGFSRVCAPSRYLLLSLSPRLCCFLSPFFPVIISSHLFFSQTRARALHQRRRGAFIARGIPDEVCDVVRFYARRESERERVYIHHRAPADFEQLLLLLLLPDDDDDADENRMISSRGWVKRRLCFQARTGFRSVIIDQSSREVHFILMRARLRSERFFGEVQRIEWEPDTRICLCVLRAVCILLFARNIFFTFSAVGGNFVNYWGKNKSFWGSWNMRIDVIYWLRKLACWRLIFVKNVQAV